MKTLVVYASKHGCVKKAADQMANAFQGETDVRNVRDLTRLDLEDYDRVLIGGSIHAGRIQGKIKSFCQRYLEQLLKKDLGLFICHMEEGDGAMKELNDNFPDKLLTHAKAKGLFGGEFDFEKMNFLEKFIVKKVSGVSESVSNINDKNILEFIKIMES